MVWIKNPLNERKHLEGFLITNDVMSFIWVVIPISFVLWMQTRSFIKMKEEKIQLLLNVDDQMDESLVLNDSDEQ